MYHSFLIHSSADGYLGCFHVLAIINSAPMKTGVHVVSFNSGFLGVYAQHGISGSYGSSISSFLRNLHTEEQFDNKILRVNILYDQSILLLGIDLIVCLYT